MYDSPLVMVWCVILMLSCLYLRPAGVLRGVIVELSACGLAVYAMHMTLVRILVKSVDFNTSAMNLLLIAVVLLVCFFAAAAMRRIPGLKYLTHI